MLVRLVYLTHKGAWLVGIDFDLTLVGLGISIRELIEKAVFTEEDLIKFRVPTN